MKMEFSFAPILKKICREVAGIPNPTDVYLEDWWLSKTNGVKGIFVSGCSVEKRRYDTHQKECDSAPTKWIGASREFHSTEVVKRHSSTTVETSNGLCVYLCGFINRSRTMENGFSSEVLRDFRYGFPFNWEDYTVESVAKESSQSNHDHFTETILPITLNTYNGAHLHDMVLSLTYAEREILNKKMYDNSMGMLNPETASGKSSKPNPPFVEEEIQLTPISSTAKVNNKWQLQTTPLNYDEHGQVGSQDPQRNHHQGGEAEAEAEEQPQLPPPYHYHHRTQPPLPFEEPFNHHHHHHHHNHLFHLEQPETAHQLRELYSQLEPHNLGPISEIQHPIKKRSYLPSSSSALPSTPLVRKKSAMGGGGNSQPVSTRSALRKAGVGEIVEVQGGHIVRATGRKDRHSKVCTAKGPRDRRVRLSANTAIQFYDVQDRLGYDRPSKAVDWLIKKAKNSIDELEQLPAWSPNMNMSTTTTRRRGGGKSSNGDENGKEAVGQEELFGGAHRQFQDYTSHSSMLPPSLDSDSIADTIKSFFPMGGTGEVGPSTTSSASPPPHMQFQDYSQGSLLNRSGGGSSSNCRQSQDLRLSLQSFQDPILLHSHHHHQAAARDCQQSLFPGAAPSGFENPNVGSTEHHQPNPDVRRLHRLVVGWNNEIGTDHNNASGIGGGSFMFNPPQILQPLFGGHHHHHSQLFTQRGPLQSSNTPAIRAWIVDPVVNSSTNNEQYHQTAISVHPQAFSGIGFSSGGFPGFQIPARIQGEEEHDGDPCKPSSASSGSCH